MHENYYKHCLQLCCNITNAEILYTKYVDSYYVIEEQHHYDAIEHLEHEHYKISIYIKNFINCLFRITLNDVLDIVKESLKIRRYL